MSDYPRRRQQGKPRVDDYFYDNPEPDDSEEGSEGDEGTSAGSAGADDPTAGARSGSGATAAGVEGSGATAVGAEGSGATAVGAEGSGATAAGAAGGSSSGPAARRRARRSVLGRVARTGAIVGVAAGMVYAAGAGHVPTLDLAAALGEEQTVPTSTVQPAGLATVTSASLGCVGPEQVGLDDPSVPEPEQTVAIAVGSAPAEALPEFVAPSGDGDLQLTGVPEGDGEQVRERGAAARLELSGDTWARASATGSLAAGLGGSQMGLSLTEQQRGLTTAPCQPAGEDSWLVGGGAEPGRVERLILANPTGNPVTVDVEILGAGGPVEAAGGRGIVVPAGERAVVLVDALAPGEARPVLHVTSTGGSIVAALGDRWLEGTIDRGTELTTPTAPPALQQVIPAVPAGGGDADSAFVRIAAPGQEDAVVQLRALTPEGPVRVANAVASAEAGAVVDVDVSDLPAGTHAIEVTADTPVVAAAQVDRRLEEGGASDLAWVPAVEPSSGLVGAALAQVGDVAPERELSIASQEGAQVEVVAVVGGVPETQQVEVPAAGSVGVGLDPSTESVWVRVLSGEAASAVVSTVEDEAGVLVAGLPLPEAPTTRQVRAVAPWLP